MNIPFIARRQLDDQFSKLQPLKDQPRPPQGWLRAIRDALNMSGAQLAQRIGVSRQRISALEKAEVDGSVSINSLRQAAASIDCELVYALVPRGSLESYVLKSARHLAREQHQYTSHTMSLEDQSLASQEDRDALQDTVDELVRTSSKRIWD